MVSPLLRTKLHVPVPHPDLVPRPRLVERLNEGLCLGRPLTLVSAPAGYGKTTLIAQWLQTVDRPVTWLSLDESENDISRFLSYLVAALQGIHDGIGRPVQMALESSAAPAVVPVMTALINDIAGLDRPFILALDDCHLIRGAATQEAIRFLVDHRTPTMHLVLLTREDPPVPVARLRINREMTEVRQEDLRFTRVEADAFFERTANVTLSASAMDTLAMRTEGWVAGMQSAALSLQNRDDVEATVARFGGEDRYLVDYLTEEVLERQGAEIQAFLLYTSVVQGFNADLCDALLDRDHEALRTASPSQAILEQLENANLFVVPLDNRRGWYRYHHLFQDLLSSQLRRKHPDLVPALHRRASRWYRMTGLVDEAIEHALGIPDPGLVADILERHLLPQARNSRLGTCMRWLKRLPEQEIIARPYLCASVGWVYALGGQIEAAERYVGAGEAALAVNAPAVLNPEITAVSRDEVRGELMAIRACCRLRGDYRGAFEVSQQALSLMPENAHASRAAATLTLGMAQFDGGLGDLGEAAFEETFKLGMIDSANMYAAVHALSQRAYRSIMRGHLGEAERFCRQAIDLGSRESGQALPAVCHARNMLASALFFRNDLEEAEQHLEQASQIAELADIPDAIVRNLSFRARIAIIKGGDLAEARAMVARAKALIDTRRVSPSVVMDWNLRQAQLLRRRGGVARVARFYEEECGWGEAELLGDPDRPHDITWAVACDTMAALRSKQGRYDDAIRLADAVLTEIDARGGDATGTQFHLIVKAEAYWGKGEEEKSFECFFRALELAEPEGNIMNFVSDRGAIPKLLHKALEHGIRPRFVRRILDEIQKQRGPARALTQPTRLEDSADGALPEPLTAREAQVLRLLSANVSTRNICDHLVIAITTLRAHIRAVYRKLDVHSREEAIERGEELGLI